MQFDLAALGVEQPQQRAFRQATQTGSKALVQQSTAELCHTPAQKTADEEAEAFEYAVGVEAAQ